MTTLCKSQFEFNQLHNIPWPDCRCLSTYLGKYGISGAVVAVAAKEPKFFSSEKSYLALKVGI